MDVHLESIDPERNRFRSYVLSIEPDLFDEWALVVTWGRIGRRGRTRIAASGDLAAVQRALARLQRQRLQHGYVLGPDCEAGTSRNRGVVALAVV